MANGKAHEKLNISFLVLGVLVAVIMFNKDWYVNGSYLILGYLIGTFYLNPDLDLVSRPFKRWGIIKFVWYPYQTFKHRSIWTHGYIIGDVIRYAYILSLFVIPILLLSCLPFVSAKIIDHFFILLEEYKISFFLIVAGNVLSSAAHTLTDQTTSTFKKIIK